MLEELIHELVFEYEEFTKKLASPSLCMDPSYDMEMGKFKSYQWLNYLWNLKSIQRARK